jgi:ribosomal protein S12 methylthiotransferase accessory factor
VEIPLQPGEPRVFVMVANCTRPKYFLRNTAFHAAEADYVVPANGVGFTRAEALWSVLGEACERYTAGIYDDTRFSLASREELGSAALPVEDLIAFSERQYARPDFPFQRFDPTARMRWVAGRNLATGREVLVPAALAYFGYEALSTAEIFYPTLSTGMAAGRTLEQALLSGLCEVVERDAFMACWLLRHPPYRIALPTLREGLRGRERVLLDTAHFDISVVQATTDVGVPSVLTLLRPRARRTAVLGAAAHPCLRRAVVKSLLEAYHTLNWSIFLERTPKFIDRAGVKEFEDHVRYYLDPSHAKDINWLAEGVEGPAPFEAEPVPDTATLLSRTVAQLVHAGYQPCFVETTTPDVRELGFRTVRVIVPGLHPLSMGADRVHEDDRRLRKVAAYWGIPLPQELNMDPHPFP